MSAPAPVRVPPLAALGHRDFRLLYVGLLISTMGTQISNVTNGWLVFQLTGNPASLGLFGLFSALPLIPMSLLGGALADAVERRRLMLAMQLLSLLTMAALAVLTATGLIQVWHIYASGFLLTITGVVDRPARQALIPSLVPRDHLLNAFTLMTTLIQAGGLLGPVIAGFTLAYFGPAVAYGLDSISFLAVVVALVLMHVPAIEGGGRKVTLDAIVDGLRFVGSKQIILGLFGLDIVAMLFGYYNRLLPVYADLLQVGPQGLGLLSSAPAAGSLLGAGTMLMVGRVRRPGWTMLGAVAIYGLALVGLGLTPTAPGMVGLAAAMLCCGVAGLSDAVSMAIRHTTIQTETPDQYRGRVSSAMQISVQGGNSIGSVDAGFAAQWLGTGPATMLGGGLVIASVVVFGWLVKPMRTYRAH